MIVHIFDVDYTVLRKTSAQYFLRVALREKYIRFSQIYHLPLEWIKYKIASPDMDFIESTVKKLSGLKKSDMENISEVCFEKYAKKNIYSESAKLIREALNKGQKVIFATSSFDFIIKPLENFFGIEGSLATRMEYSDGITTGNLSGYSLFGVKKKTAALEWMKNNGIKAQDVIFYSDSYTDIPLLECCGTAVAVNPDRILKRKAKKENWKILLIKDVIVTS